MVPTTRPLKHDEAPLLLHPHIWAIHEALALLALPEAGRARGESWVPVGDGIGVQYRGNVFSLGVRELITKIHKSSSVASQVGQYFSGDFAALNMRMESVPIEEVLEFKEDHREDFEEYLIRATTLVSAASALPTLDREIGETESEVRQRAADLEAAALRRWGITAGVVTLSLGGFVWYAAQGQYADGLITALPGLIGALPSRRSKAPDSARLFSDMTVHFAGARR